MSTALAVVDDKRVSLVQKFAGRYSVEPDKLLTTLKATAFKQRDNKEISNEQMMALMIVADQYKLNPFTKEIYAYPDKQNGIVPVVGVDGWSRIINEHPMLDGIEFRYSEAIAHPKGGKPCPEWCEVIITRKDRAKPIIVREYLDEVFRDMQYASPWQTHTKRMLRHKTLIQGARIAFGFAGIYDEDEAQRIIDMGEAHVMDEPRPTIEMPKAKSEPKPETESAPAAPASPPSSSSETGGAAPDAKTDGGPLGDGAKATLRRKLQSAGRTEVDLQAAGFDINTMPFSRFADAMRWVSENKAA